MQKTAFTWRILISLLICGVTAAITSDNTVPSPHFSSEPKSPIDYRYNFHRDPPLLPHPKATLADLEANATDDFILRTMDQVVLPEQAHGSYNSDVILKYKPHGLWLLSRWHGTILQSSLTKVLLNMALSTAVCVILRYKCDASWGWGVEPSAVECSWVAKLDVFDKLWHYQQTLTTFILTFFLGQAYNLWRDMYKTARTIQGRLNDVGILVATHAKRTNDQKGRLTDESRVFLHTIARQLRLYHILVWASNSRQFKILLTNRGLTLMMERGLLTADELDVLLSLPVPPGSRHSVIIEWIIVEIDRAHQIGFMKGTQYQKVLLTKLCELRGTCAGIGDIVDGRMPLAYAHFVEFLVDSFLFASPLALYAELGVFNIICVGMLTLFYAGLLDLAKIFLDPLDNEQYGEGGIDMDLGVFIRESNAASLRWIDGLGNMPAFGISQLQKEDLDPPSVKEEASAPEGGSNSRFDLT